MHVPVSPGGNPCGVQNLSEFNPNCLALLFMAFIKLGTSPPETYSASAYAALFEDLIIVAFNKSSTVYCFPATNFIPYGITDAV